MEWLLVNVFHVKVPEHHHARAQPTEVRVMVPRTYHADGMVLFSDAADRPVLAAVVEVQRSWVRGKLRTWKLYTVQLEAELNVNAVLVVYCPDPALAGRYRQLVESDGLSSVPLRPLIFTPDDVPPDHGCGPGPDSPHPGRARGDLPRHSARDR